MHLIDQATLDRLKLRWGEYTKHLKDPKLADPETVELLLIINQIPSMVSIFSCQGHVTKTRKLAAGSLMLGTTNPVYTYFFYEKLTELVGCKTQAISLKLTYKRDVTLPRDQHCPWYKVWIVNWIIDDKTQTLVWKALIEAANLTLTKYKEDYNLIGR